MDSATQQVYLNGKGEMTNIQYYQNVAENSSSLLYSHDCSQIIMKNHSARRPLKCVRAKYKTHESMMHEQ